MPRHIPERTVDSLLAAEIVRHDPHALIWSPSNTAGAVDHEVVSTGGFLTIFECKAVDAQGGGRWVSEVPLRQLHVYATGALPIHYLFLGKPTRPQSPQRRDCRTCGGFCLACCRDARSWSLLATHVAHAAPRLRLQPWFCHWAWVIRAGDLAAHLGATAASTGVRHLPVEDADMDLLAGAVRFCHHMALPPSGRGTPSDTAPLSDNFGRIADVRVDDPDSTPPIVTVSLATSPPLRRDRP